MMIWRVMTRRYQGGEKQEGLVTHQSFLIFVFHVRLQCFTLGHYYIDLLL